MTQTTFFCCLGKTTTAQQHYKFHRRGAISASCTGSFRWWSFKYFCRALKIVKVQAVFFAREKRKMWSNVKLFTSHHIGLQTCHLHALNRLGVTKKTDSQCFNCALQIWVALKPFNGKFWDPVRLCQSSASTVPEDAQHNLLGSASISAVFSSQIPIIIYPIEQCPSLRFSFFLAFLPLFPSALSLLFLLPFPSFSGAFYS